MIPDELDIEDISDIRSLNRGMLLVVLSLIEGDRCEEIAFRAVEYNALDSGWEMGIHAMGSIWPSHKGIRLSPQDLDTVVRLARYLVTVERTVSPTASADGTGDRDA